MTEDRRLRRLPVLRRHSDFGSPTPSDSAELAAVAEVGYLSSRGAGKCAGTPTGPATPPRPKGGVTTAEAHGRTSTASRVVRLAPLSRPRRSRAISEGCGSSSERFERCRSDEASLSESKVSLAHDERPSYPSARLKVQPHRRLPTIGGGSIRLPARLLLAPPPPSQ